MAKGKNVYAVMYCPETGDPLKTIYFSKSKFSPADFKKLKVFSPRANKRVNPNVKIIKKSN